MLNPAVAVQHASQVVTYISDAARQPTSQRLAYLSLLIAALAVVVGPFIQRSVAKQQLLGPMRQAWINDLRKRISEFTSISERLVYARQVDPELVKSLLRVAELNEEIELSLNPKEEAHNDLLAELSTMKLATSAIADAEAAGKGDEKKEEYSRAKFEALRISKDIFKSEWEQIKGWRHIRRWWRKYFNRGKAF